jgi:hypothetical protein
MELEPVQSTRPLKVGAIAVVIFVVLVGVGRLFKLTLHAVSKRLDGFVPRHVSRVVGFTIAAVLFRTPRRHAPAGRPLPGPGHRYGGGGRRPGVKMGTFLPERNACRGVLGRGWDERVTSGRGY